MIQKERRKRKFDSKSRVSRMPRTFSTASTKGLPLRLHRQYVRCTPDTCRVGIAASRRPWAKRDIRAFVDRQYRYRKSVHAPFWKSGRFRWPGCQLPRPDRWRSAVRQLVTTSMIVALIVAVASWRAPRRIIAPSMPCRWDTSNHVFP